jgi:hypothetical protein
MKENDKEEEKLSMIKSISQLIISNCLLQKLELDECAKFSAN